MPLQSPPLRKNGFVLVFTILLIMGVTSIAVGTLFRSKMNRTTSVNYKNKIRTFNAADGLMTLLAQEIVNGNQNKYFDTTRYGKIYGKVWTGVGGTSVKDLKDRKSAQPTPNYTDSSYYLGSNWDFDNYGVIWSGYLMPPISGSYTFYLRSDDASAFYLSSDTLAAHLSTSPVCSLASWTDLWPTIGTGVSQPIPLLAGKRYYFEYWHKEGGGGDHGQMGWDGPEYLRERPISGEYLSQYASDPAYSGIDTVGNIPVAYRIAPSGVDTYGLRTEAVLKKVGSAADTAYRVPLNQTLSVKGGAIAPPSRIWLRAIFYDFYANKTNPEFEPWSTITNFYSYSGGVKQGMVESKLTTNPLTHSANADYFGLATLKKPRRKANNLGNRNCNLDKWFIPWASGGSTWGPRYTNSTGTSNDNNDCTSKNYGHDTAWKNAVVKDSIPFDLDVSQGPNTYVFSRVGFNATPTERYFFWLDSLVGLPSEPKYVGKDSTLIPLKVLHNFGWCMEMHTTFLHQSGLTFRFLGDDDVWLFINDSLVIDLGGMHGASTGEVNLDDLRDLQFGKTYPLDFFYCERKRDESSCRIITNIPSVRTTGSPVARWKRDYGSLD